MISPSPWPRHINLLVRTYLRMSSDILTCNLTQPPLLNTSSQEQVFCHLDKVKEAYIPIHGYLAIITCLLGTIFNMLNIMVLTGKHMRSNPINLILTGIALADIVLMLEYVPFTVHMYLISADERPLDQKVKSISNKH